MKPVISFITVMLTITLLCIAIIAAFVYGIPLLVAWANTWTWFGWALMGSLIFALFITCGMAHDGVFSEKKATKK